MTDGDALLRAIRECPDDDTVRLVYADWLDEHGEPDRAEFIRLQCELALRADGGDETCRKTCVPPDFEGCPCRERMTRDWELQHRSVHTRWFAIAGLSPRVSLDADGSFGWHETDRPNSRRVIKGYARRGFVSRIELSCDAFLRHAGEIFAAHPVTDVALTGKVPADTEGEFGWYRSPQNPNAYQSLAGHVLPSELWLPIPRPNDTKFAGWKFFADREGADGALSAACVAYGRAEAKKREPAGATTE